MNLRKLKNQAGFTLVELIVVIAIMAILAGVAVPVYSGYIEKANKAADLQLLGAVNSSFSAACYENGAFDLTKVDGKITLQGSEGAMTVGAVSATGDTIAADADINGSFFKYYEGNQTAAFKVITALYYKDGVFVADEVTAYTYTDANGNKITINVPQSTIDAINNSTYSEIGSGTLLGQVDSVSNLALQSILGGGTFADVVYDENGAYFSKLAESLGMTPAELESSFETEDAMNEFLANSLILSAAGGTAGMDADTAISKLESDPNTYIAQIKSDLSDPAKAESALADAALIYGVYTSYVYATDPDNAAEKLSTVNGAGALVNALTEMQSADFETYMSEGGGDADLKAYLEAMKVVNSAASDPAAKKDILNKGFTDEQLSSLLQGVMGK